MEGSVGGRKIAAILALAAPALIWAQGKGAPPADLLKPLKESWPTYNGDYTGRRYSALAQVDRSNVQHLTLAWMLRVTPGAGSPGGGGAFGGRGGRGGFGGPASRLTV